MFRWLAKLFRREPTRIEVTVNVPAVSVFVSGSEARGEEAALSEHRSGVRAEEERPALRDAPQMSDEERIDGLAQRLNFSTLPEVDFGETQSEEKKP